jgi:hypothetical protein
LLWLHGRKITLVEIESNSHGPSSVRHYLSLR